MHAENIPWISITQQNGCTACYMAPWMDGFYFSALSKCVVFFTWTEPFSTTIACDIKWRERVFNELTSDLLRRFDCSAWHCIALYCAIPMSCIRLHNPLGFIELVHSFNTSIESILHCVSTMPMPTHAHKTHLALWHYPRNTQWQPIWLIQSPL